MARQDEALVAEYFGEEGIAGWKQATGGGKSSGPARSPGRFAGDDRPFSVNGDRAGKGFGGRDLDGDFGESDFDDEFDADFDVEGMDEDDDDFDAGPSACMAISITANPTAATSASSSRARAGWR